MLGTDEFPRVRVGIRKGEPPEDLADYVLSRFPAPRTCWSCRRWWAAPADAVECLLGEGAPAAMNRFNGPAGRVV